jgi:hypothetical protein
MRFTVFHFALRVLRWIALFSLVVLLVLSVFDSLYLFPLILVYEALLVLIMGILPILGSYIYRKNSFPSRYGRTGWFDFKRFAKLTPKQRQRYRQEGKIMVIIGIILLAVAIILHFAIVE